MKRLIYVALLLLLWFPPLVSGKDLRTSFSGSRFDGLTRSTTIFESDMRTDENGDLVDISGENLHRWSDDVDQWGGDTRATVTVNQYRFPTINGIVGDITVDMISEDGTLNNSHMVRETIIPGLGSDDYKYSIYVMPLNRTWVAISISIGGAYRYGYFNLSTCSLGTIDANYNFAEITKNGSYCKCTVAFTNPTSDDTRIYIAEDDIDITFDGLSQPSIAIGGAHIREYQKPNPFPNEDFFIKTTGNAKPRLTLADNGAPAVSKSTYQDMYGNNFDDTSGDGTGAYYFIANPDSVKDIWVSDHTLTFIAKARGGSYNDRLFTHGAVSTSGLEISIANTGAWRVRYNDSGLVPDFIIIDGVGDIRDNLYHIIQIVRSSNVCIVYIDGIAGTPIDITGYGVTATTNMTLMGRFNNTLWLDGAVQYTKIDREALSTTELAFDRDVINGLASGTGFIDPSWTFTRTTTAKKNCSQIGPQDVAINTPRVTDGVLIEAQGTNFCLQSQTFDSGTWVKTRSSVVADQAIAPDGTLTADAFREDGTLANNHYMQQGAISVTASNTYTAIMYVKGVPGLNKDWGNFVVVQTGADPTVYLNIINGVIGANANTDNVSITPVRNDYFRCRMTWTATATENVSVRWYLAEADGDRNFDGVLNQVDHYLWGADIKEGAYPTSYIETTTAPVTRTADLLTIDPHEPGTNKIILPDEINSTGILTIEFDAKCAFSEAAEISTEKYLVGISGDTGTASGNDNRMATYVDASGRFVGLWRDNSTSEVWRTVADIVNYSTKNTFKVTVDFSDMTNNQVYVNGVDSTDFNNATGSDVFDLSGTDIRVVSNYTDVGQGDCKISNVRVEYSK